MATSEVQIYLNICLVNMWHLNIFRYLFGELCGIQIYSDICLGPFYDICPSLATTLTYTTTAPPELLPLLELKLLLLPQDCCYKK